MLTARHEGVPVLAITSQHRAGVVYPSTPATFQGQDQIDLFKPVVKWNGPVFEWTRIPELVRMAFREMWAGRPGPVHLEIPGPTLYATGDDTTAPIFPCEAGRASQPQPSDTQLSTAADLLAGAIRPVIFAGTGVDRARANAALIELAELLGCPMIPSMAGRAVVPNDHPLYFHSQSPAADELRRNADVMLVVGSRVGNLDVPFDKYWGDPVSCRVIHVDIDPRHVGVSRPVALGLVADARATLEGLVARLRGRVFASAGRTDVAAQRVAFESWANGTGAAIASWQGPGIHPAHAISAVGGVFGRDAVYHVDGGMTSLWAALALPQTRPNSYHGIMEFGMLGTGIPAAAGSKLGAPQREVVCVTGDGAAGFNVMELETAVREKLKLTVVVMAESEWTMEIPNEMARWGRTFGTTTGEVRWDRVAEGLGCRGEYVDSIEALPAALARCRAHTGPALVCVRTSKLANLSVPEAGMARFFEVYFGPSA
jgi:acetolactate synthase-1/2/3 large subunit